MTTHDTDERDPLVTAAYRELGDEQTPEYLDRAVLDMASAGGPGRSPGNTVLALWMKPVAWAATIGLCLAIVLEYSEVPSTGAPAVVAPAPASVGDNFVPTNQDMLEEASNRAMLQTGPGPEAVREEQPVENIDVSTVEQKRKIDSFAASAPTASKSVARERAAALEVTTPQSIPVTGEAVAAPASLAAESRGPATNTPCTATIRESADGWLECILELRRAGFEEIADQEYELFAREFPADWAEFEANK